MNIIFSLTTTAQVGDDIRPFLNIRQPRIVHPVTRNQIFGLSNESEHVALGPHDTRSLDSAAVGVGSSPSSSIHDAVEGRSLQSARIALN